MKHTPGPWGVVNQKHVTGRVDIGIAEATGTHRWIARITQQPEISFDQEVADAILMALAPEMFEALKQCDEILRDEYNWHSEGPLGKKIEKILKKVRGT